MLNTFPNKEIRKDFFFALFQYKQDFPNLANLGIDAQIALDFHHLRRDTPELCASVVLNKFWYATYGAKAMFTGLENLEDFITLIVDGKQVRIMLATNSYSACQIQKSRLKMTRVIPKIC